MKNTNSTLHAKAASYESATAADTKEDEELVKLLSKWQVLNAIRAVLPAIAALSGLWAIITRPEFLGMAIQ
jgi:hypothetical protein